MVAIAVLEVRVKLGVDNKTDCYDIGRIVREAINELDYGFSSPDSRVKVLDTEVINTESIELITAIGNLDLLNPLCLAGNRGKIHILEAQEPNHKDWTLCGRIPTKIIGYSSQREGVTCNTCRKIWEKFIMEVTNDTAFLYEHK